MTATDPKTQPDWHQIGWNGLRFRVPQTWQPAKIGRHYMMFEDGSGPRMELKWNAVKGTFSPKANLRKIGAAHSRALRKSLRIQLLPASWQKALQRFDTTGFSWQSDATTGNGVMLYCRHCKKATLIQFLGLQSNSERLLYDSVLSSFRDHPENESVLWRLYDIRAQLPRDMSLKQHRFNAGAFQLEFEFQKAIFGLHRWAPANALLQNIGLQGFAEQWAGHYSNQPLDLQHDGDAALAALVPSPRSRLARYFPVIPQPAGLQFVRIWHLEVQNRILALRVEGRRLPDLGLIESICRDFEAV